MSVASYDLPANAKKCLPAAYLATVRLLVTVGAEVTSNKLTHWFARQMIRFISQCTELARDLVALARIRRGEARRSSAAQRGEAELAPDGEEATASDGKGDREEEKAMEGRARRR